jgi:hypothetical protein
MLAESVFKEHGNQLSVEARDKYGKTLLMVIHSHKNLLNLDCMFYRLTGTSSFTFTSGSEYARNNKIR